MNRILNALTRPVQTLFRLPMKLVAAPRKIWGLSLPTRVAIAVGLVILVILITLYFAGIRPGDRTGDVPYLVLAVLLAITIPFAVRWAIKLWLEGPASQFPEIDKAWSWLKPVWV